MARAPQPRVSDDQLREAARRAIARGSLRSTAEAIGLSPSGLDIAVNHSKRWKGNTRTRLLDWYLGAGRTPAYADTATAASALDVLTEMMTEAEKAQARSAVLEILAKAHREARREPPRWIAELKESPES
ncbi:MAG TPA: hypothetical protein VFX98_03965 [Longimicrobiaceae bacterium]|nr:hypothetical protein [Longimicrobiaceae bacterium]